jgi:hypothetical protein
MITARTKQKKPSAQAGPAPEKEHEPLDPGGIYPPPGMTAPGEEISGDDDASGQETDM